MEHLRRIAAIMAGLAMTLLTLAATAPSAFAMRLIEQPSMNTPGSVSTPRHGGLGWEVTIIAVAAALAAIALTALIVRVRLRPGGHPAPR
jgi:hypothetical protein